MADRSQEIQNSLRQAKEIEQKLKETDQNKINTLLQAKKDAQAIIDQTNKEAEILREKKVSELRLEMEKIVAQTKTSLANEKEQMIREVKSEVADLVIAVSSKLLEKNIDNENNKKLIASTVEQVGK